MTTGCPLKRRLRSGVAVVAVVGFLLQTARAIAGDKTTESSVTSTTTARAPMQKMQTKDGSQLWSESCAMCHNMRSPSSYSDAEWEVVMHHMRIRAHLTPDEHKAILEFLKSAN